MFGKKVLLPTELLNELSEKKTKSTTHRTSELAQKKVFLPTNLQISSGKKTFTHRTSE